MSLTKQEILRWVQTLPDNSTIGITSGGLALQSDEQPQAYLEVGGTQLQIGDTVDATTKEGDFPHEFQGRISGISGNYYQVTDSNDDTFDCDSDQLTRAE
jgi:hypothetical protein